MTVGVQGEPADETVASVITGSGPSTAQDTAGRPGVPITIEQAYRAKVRAAAAAAAEPPEPGGPAVPDLPNVPDLPAVPDCAAAAVPSPPQTGASRDPEVLQSRPGPPPARPGPPGSGGPAVRRPPAAPAAPPHLRARPRIEPEQGILGLSRHTRSRLGSRLFNLFFVCVFALILVQMVVALLTP